MRTKKQLTIILMLMSLFIISTNITALEPSVSDENDTISELSQEEETPSTLEVSEDLELENSSDLDGEDNEVVQEEGDETVTRHEIVAEEVTPKEQTPPSDWAFDPSSRPLHDAILAGYPAFDSNGDGFISVSEAESYSQERGIELISMGIEGTMNGIENFTGLTALVLTDNPLTGMIPKSIGNLSKLTTISITNADFSGTIPESIGNLTELTNLTLASNQLTGTIPESIGNLTELTNLTLANNQLTGMIPKEIGNLTELRSLWLMNNQLAGMIPESIGNLTKLSNLSLYDNQFTDIPRSVYDAVVNARYGSIVKQRSNLTLQESGKIYENYSFDAYPAYQQIPEYDARSQFTYSLKRPDGINSEVMPILKDGTLTVGSNDLTQAGTYVLTAMIPGESVDTGGEFYGTTYTTTFTVDKVEVSYLQLESNGAANKETTGTLTITVDGPLDAEDIKLSLIAPKENETITKKTVTEVGAGVYEVAVSGQWEEGREVKVELVENDSIIYTPSERTTILHTIGTHTLSFDSQGGSSVADQFIEYGKPASAPQPPTKVGHTFAGWYTDTTWRQAWDFDKDVVTDNLTLYAKWEVIVIEADDIELTVSEVLGLDEESFLDRTNAVLKIDDSLTLNSFALTDTLKVLAHTIEAKPGVYMATIAAQTDETVQKEVQVTVVADAVSEPETSSGLPQTGVSSTLWSYYFIIIMGIVLILSKKRAQSQ